MRRKDIADLAQEIVPRLVRYRGRVVIENPQRFLSRIASSVVREWRERIRLQRSHDHRLEEPQVEPVDESDSSAAQQEGNEHLRAAVDRLSPLQRDVLLLHVNEGLTSQRIAELRGLDPLNVVRTLAHAYAQLRRDVKLEDL